MSSPNVAKLVRIGPGAGHQEILLGDITTVGRQPSNSLQIVDRLVSKEHAIISRRPGTNFFVLRDLDSRNGTYCNDVLVEEARPLYNGDTVRIGSTSWRFVGPEPEPEQATARMDGSGGGGGADSPAEDDAPASIHATMQLDLVRDFAPADLVADEKTLRTDYEKLRLAYTLNNELHGERDVDRMLDKVMQRIFEWFPVDRGIVMLVDESEEGGVTENLHTMAVRVRAGVQFDEDSEVKVPRSILHQAAVKREAVLSTDARMDDRFGQAHSVVLQGIRSSMTSPLITNDRLVGILHVDSLVSTGLFAEKDLAVLTAVARQAAISIDNVLLQRRVRDEAAARESLSRMMSPNLVDQIVSGDLKIEKGGTLRRVSVLFADVRGFTNLTERTPPAEMVQLMNEYFERVTKVIFEYHGTLDKYIGDAVMALWGAPIGTDDDEINAVRAAFKMQQAVDEFNEVRREQGLEEIEVGIGVATGQLIAGYMGSTQTMSYTVLGRKVNLSARLCGMAKPGEVLLGPTTYDSVKDRIEAETLEPVTLKGIIDQIRPYRVIDCEL